MRVEDTPFSDFSYERMKTMLEELIRRLEELTGDDPVSNIRRTLLIAEIEKIIRRRSA